VRSFSFRKLAIGVLTAGQSVQEVGSRGFKSLVFGLSPAADRFHTIENLAPPF
jgi:hypothetical protein